MLFCKGYLYSFWSWQFNSISIVICSSLGQQYPASTVVWEILPHYFTLCSNRNFNLTLWPDRSICWTFGQTDWASIRCQKIECFIIAQWSLTWMCQNCPISTDHKWQSLFLFSYIASNYHISKFSIFWPLGNCMYQPQIWQFDNHVFLGDQLCLWKWQFDVGLPIL